MLAYRLLSALALTVAALTRGATAQLIHTYAYSNAVQCGGAYAVCATRAAACCNIPADYGYSVYISSLPSGASSEGFQSPNCVGSILGIYGPGSFCTISGGMWRVASTNWHFSARQPVSASTATADDECVSPIAFGYETDEGVKREIKIPVGVANATETVAALYLAKDFEALAKYEAHSTGKDAAV